MTRFTRIALVNPPNVEQGGYTPSPLGLLYLAAYLRRDKKLKIKVIDAARLGEKEMKNVFKEFRPDLVGISSLTPGRYEALKVAAYTKKLYPHCKTVLGGIHPTIMWGQVMTYYPQVDYIVRGEGEETLWELVQGKDLTKIKGLVWRKNKKVINNSDRVLIKDLNKIPFPAWDMIDPHIYPPLGKIKVNDIDLTKETRYTIIFSRGCMGCCTFCSSWKVWKGYRYRTGKNVADEVEMLVKNYHAKHIAFYDDTLTGNREEIISFCKEIVKRKLKVAFHGTTRVDKVDKELLLWMKKAGFYEIAYGIESGSPAMLIKINKRTDLQKIFTAAKLTKQAKIRFFALMMYGLPTETKQERAMSDRLVAKLNPDGIGTVGEVWIFPGTALYERAKNAGLLDDNFWLGKKPYYVYRGGIGGDKFNRLLQLKDLLTFSVRSTFLQQTTEDFFARIDHLKTKVNKSFKTLIN